MATVEYPVELSRVAGQEALDKPRVVENRVFHLGFDIEVHVTLGCRRGGRRFWVFRTRMSGAAVGVRAELASNEDLTGVLDIDLPGLEGRVRSAVCFTAPRGGRIRVREGILASDEA